MDRAEKILNNKVAIITGSSCGIGAGIAYEFCRLGALITITGRDEEQLKAVFTKCREILPHPTKEPLVIQGDITEEEVRKKIINETVRYYGKLDILVNNAGYFLSSHLCETTTLTYLDAMLDIHVRVPFHMTKLALPELIKTKGNVINVSSVISLRPIVPKGAEYGIAKAAMDQLTRWTAYELGQYGIRANSVNPGWIPSNILKRLGVDDKKIAKSKEICAKYHALGRVGEVEEVAKVVAFLASDSSSFVSGVNLLIDGGSSVVPTSITVIPKSNL